MKDIITYIRSDYHRYYGKGYNTSLLKIILTALTDRNHCFAYSFWLRLCMRKNPFYIIARLKHYRLSRLYCVQIPPTTKIGYGLFIGHGIGIVINPDTKIGNNCNISQFLNIGSNKGTPASIGDNVYIGPSVCIVEDVKIGDNATIGAGAVVTCDIPADTTAAGIPAKVISPHSHPEYIRNKWQIN